MNDRGDEHRTPTAAVHSGRPRIIGTNAVEFGKFIASHVEPLFLLGDDGQPCFCPKCRELRIGAIAAVEGPDSQGSTESDRRHR